MTGYGIEPFLSHSRAERSVVQRLGLAQLVSGFKPSGDKQSRQGRNFSTWEASFPQTILLHRQYKVILSAKVWELNRYTDIR